MVTVVCVQLATFACINLSAFDENKVTVLECVVDRYDLVPKGAQEKRTDVLENKVDRM